MDRKDRIRETAFQMFTGIGYSAVTMDQIARGCGMGKATLYQYFPSKKDLILSCIDYFTEKIGEEVEEIVADQSLSPQQKINRFITPVIQFVSRIHAGTLNDLQRSVPEAYEKIDQNRRKIILTNIVRIVKEGKEQGIFRADLDGTLVAHILIGAISHLSTPQVLEEIGLPTGQLFKLTLSVIWEGCLSEQGRSSAH